MGKRHDYLESVILELKKHTDESHNSFPHEMRRVNRQLIKSYSDLTQIYSNDKLEDYIRFNAYYCHLLGLWRQKQFSGYRKLVDGYETSFNKYKLFNAFKAQYYLSKSKKPENYLFAVEYAEKAIKDFPDSPHILHLFSEIVADYQEFKEDSDTNLLRLAEKNLIRAISINRGQYAKYFATKARISSLLFKFEEAKDLIQLAIELEPATDSEYLIRLGDYQAIKSRISYYEHSRKIQEKQEEALKNLDEVRNKVVELLGLLSAIIAFVITSVQISKDLSFENAARLLIVLGGVCIMVFSAFSFTFYRGPLRINQLLSTLLGFVLILFGISLGLVSSYFKSNSSDINKNIERKAPDNNKLYKKDSSKVKNIKI